MPDMGPRVITLRKLSPDLARALRRTAFDRGTSVSKTVLNLLEERLGLSTRGARARVYHDLDALAGTWTEDEGAAFADALAAQRRIDPDLWR